MIAAKRFDYDTAFSRNIGLVDQREQSRLGKARVALAGLGGVGGAHLQALARMGIQRFHLADPDTFEVVNINRQMGAQSATMGRNKAEVLAEMALAINPECEVATFSTGITQDNIDAFLEDVDVVVDGIDFFCIEARQMLYAGCRERDIPVVNAGPIGYGASVLVFLPDGISFEQFFGFEDGMTRAERLMAMALGLTPGMVNDVDPAHVNVEAQRGPALAPSCLLCAAAAGTEVLKLVLGRGRPAAAPCGTYYDPYRACTFQLRPRPSFRRSLRGRLLRWLAFRRFPSMLAMHERELAERCSSVPSAAGTAKAY